MTWFMSVKQNRAPREASIPIFVTLGNMLVRNMNRFKKVRHLELNLSVWSSREKLRRLNNSLLNTILSKNFLSGLGYKDKSDIRANRTNETATPYDELHKLSVHSYRHCSPFLSAPKSWKANFIPYNLYGIIYII